MNHIGWLFLPLLLCFGAAAQNAAKIKCAHGDQAYVAKDYDLALLTYEECLQLSSFPEVQIKAARAAYYTGNLLKARKYIDMALVACDNDKQLKKSPECGEVFQVAAMIEKEENPPFIEMVAVPGGTFTMGCLPRQGQRLRRPGEAFASRNLIRFLHWEIRGDTGTMENNYGL